MAYQGLNLGDIIQQAGAIKGQQQKSQLSDLALQQAQQDQANTQGVNTTLQSNPNASLGDLVKAGGTQGIAASSNLNSAKAADLLQQNRQMYTAATQVANADDPVAAVQQYAPQFPQQYDSVHGQGAFAKLAQDPNALKQQAAGVAQHALLGLVDPDKQFAAQQTMIQDHYKQEGPGGEAQRKQMEIDAANKREQYSQGQQNARDLKPVLNPDGSAQYLPANQAAGKTPYNNSTASAGSITDQAKEFAYQKFASTGEMPQSGRGGAAMQAMYANYFAQRAAQDGNTGASIAAKGQAFKAQQGVIKDYESGPTSKTLNGINTAVQHMGGLDPLIDNLNNTKSPLWNQAANYFQKQTGQTAPTNFAAMKEFVAGEVAKAVLPGGGGEGERQALAAPLNAANSPAQLKEAVQTIKTALAGKTEALRNQWDIGTQGSQGSFDKFLLPATKKALGISGQPAAAPAVAPAAAHPPDIQALLQKYQ